jgi:hypothetical protein
VQLPSHQQQQQDHQQAPPPPPLQEQWQQPHSSVIHPLLAPSVSPEGGVSPRPEDVTGFNFNFAIGVEGAEHSRAGGQKFAISRRGWGRRGRTRRRTRTHALGTERAPPPAGLVVDVESR